MFLILQTICANVRGDMHVGRAGMRVAGFSRGIGVIGGGMDYRGAYDILFN